MPSPVEPVSKQLTIVIGLTVVGFMTFGLALSYYRNALFEQTLENIAEQNLQLKNDIELGFRDLEYYQSAQYKDKYAKENLGLVRPGEKVLILAQQTNAPSDMPQEPDGSTPREEQQAAYEELLRQMPILYHWQLYLFYPNKIEELRRAL